MKVNNKQGSRSSVDRDAAEMKTRDNSKNLNSSETGAPRTSHNQQKHHNRKGKSWRKALNENGGDTTEDAASSALSDLSDSTEDLDGNGGGTASLAGERSEDYELFEKALRSKHSKACKAMSVRRSFTVLTSFYLK